MKKQSNKKRRFIRPSPNEEAAIVQSEQERRKKIRLKQVREQEKAFSLKVRKSIKNKRDSEMKILSEELQKQWTEKQLIEQKTLEDKYNKNLTRLGDGHTAAVVDQNTHKKDGRVLTKEDKKRAIDRHNEALHQLILMKEKEQEIQRYQTNARVKAIEAEKARSAVIASLPPPKDILLDLELVKDNKPQTKKAEDYKSTHFHLQRPMIQVEKMDKDSQADARFAAKVAEFEIQGNLEETQKSKAEQAEKALLRHRHALAQLKIEEDHKRLMGELGELERIDRQRRQEAVAKIPVRIFQPPHKRVEDAEERQRDLEQAFEDMYMIQTGYTGDLTIALDTTEDPLIPEQHQFLVPDKRNEDQQEESIPTFPPEECRPTEGHQDTIESQEDVGPPGESVIEDKEQRDTVPPKGEDAVKRLLLRIQRQREQAKEVRPIEAKKDDKDQKTPVHKAGKSTGSRVNIMTPLPEEEEHLSDEDIPRIFLPRAHHDTRESAPKDLSKDSAGNAREVRMLLHPQEAARKARVVASLKEKENIAPIQKTTPSASDEDELQKQQRLMQQLEEQRLIQQRLEDQLKEYHKRVEVLPSEPSPEPYPDPYDDFHDSAQGQSRESNKKEKTEKDGLVIESKDKKIIEEKESIEDGVGEGSLSSIETGALSLEEQTVDETSETSSSVSGAGTTSERPQKISPALTKLHHHLSTSTTDNSSRATYDSNHDHFRSAGPREQSSLSFKRLETTGDSFPRESSSESEGRQESEDLSSSSGSLDFRHEQIPTSRYFSHGIDRTLPSTTLSSDSSRNRISNKPGANLKSSSDTITTSYSGPFQRVQEIQSYFQSPNLRTADVVNVTPSPSVSQSTPPLSKPPRGTPNYLEEYRRKWEEEKLLIENQRQIIKQKQEQQLQRMRYYKNILDRYEKGSSSDVEKAPRIPMTSTTSTIQGQLAVRPRHADDISILNKANENAPGSKEANHFARLQESSSSSDNSFRKSLPWTSDSNSSGRLRHRLTMTSRKSTSTSDFSLPSSGTEYRSLPISPNPSVLSTNLDLANGSRSSMTTLSELHEMMSKFTSSSENEKQTGRMSWSEYLTEGTSPKRGATEIAPGAPFSTQESSTLTNLTDSFSEVQGATDTVMQEKWYLPPKPITSTVGGRQESFSNTSEFLLQDRKGDKSRVNSENESRQFLRTSAPKTGPTSNTQSPSNLQGLTSSSSSELYQWLPPPKASVQSISSVDHNKQGLPLDIQAVDNSQSSSSERHQWILPPKASSQSIEAQRDELRLGPQEVGNVQSSTSASSIELHQWLLPPTASAQSIGSDGQQKVGLRSANEADSNVQGSTSGLHSEMHPSSWESVQTIGSVELQKGTRSDTQVVSNATTSGSSSPLQWIIPSKSSIQSVSSLDPAKNVSSLNAQEEGNVQSTSGGSSPIHKWLFPPKSSTQSINEPFTKGVDADRQVASDVQSSNTSSSLPQWFIPPSTNTLESAVEGSSSNFKPTEQSPVKWYLPKKASFQSVALQESIYEASSPDQSVFLKETENSMSPTWQFPTSSVHSSAPESGLSTHFLGSPNLPDDESDSSSSTSENIKARLRNMGDALLKLDKLLDVPSPTPSLSSGSLDVDNNATSQSEHSINTSPTNESAKVNETDPNSGSSFQAVEETKDVSQQDSEIREDDNAFKSAPSLESDSVSLQEAFAAKKQDFVAKSLERVARAKEKRFEVKPRVHVKKKNPQPKKKIVGKKQSTSKKP